MKGSQSHWILQNPREKLTVLVFWNFHSLSPESVEIANLVRKQFKNHYILYEYTVYVFDTRKYTKIHTRNHNTRYIHEKY